MGIENWDSNPDNNNAAPPAGAPENTTLVSDLNNIARQIMADVRAWYELQWTDLGLALEATGGGNAIVLSGDQSQYFEVNQRVQFIDGGGTKVATITNISVATNTTLTVSVAVTHPVSQVWNGIKPSVLPAIITADLVGNVTGNVTGNLNGIHATGSIASGVTAETQAAADDSQEVATTAFVQQELGAIPPGIGVGQNWAVQSRSLSTVYQNDTGAPIQVIASIDRLDDGSNSQAYVEDDPTPAVAVSVFVAYSGSGESCIHSFIVPPGHYYSVTAGSGGSLQRWVELR